MTTASKLRQTPIKSASKKTKTAIAAVPSAAPAALAAAGAAPSVREVHDAPQTWADSLNYYVDLVRRSVLSSGDNITPPHQALAWLPAIYPDTAALKAAGQRIIYLLNTHVGHLGIFVSDTVAQHAG